MSLASFTQRLASFFVVASLSILSIKAIPPSIVNQPSDVTVTAGATATFTVTVTGTLPITFQWMKNGVNLTGKTSASLVLTSVTTADAGLYAVTVSNADGATTSANATLTVNPGTPTPPTIVTQPLSQTLPAGATASFSVQATGSVPLSFQWMKDGVALNGQTSSILTLNSISAADTGNYSVKVSNSEGSVISATAALTVTGQVTPTVPTIVTQPISATVAAGGNASFTVSASGTAPLAYQWMKDGVNLSGQTGTTLTLNNVSASDTGNYSVKVSNSAGTVVSGTATLTVTGGTTGTPPAIISQPLGLTVAAGASATFAVSASGTAPLSYQWLKDGAALTGRTSATLTLNNVSASDAGNYSVQVSNAAGTVVSATATLTVTGSANPTPPTIVTQPLSLTVAAGGTASFTVSANGTAPLTFQWMKDGVNISGQTGASLTITNVSSVQAGNYSVKVSNAAGTVVSANATLTVTPVTNPIPPTIVSQPLSLTVAAGATASFQVSANGTAPLKFQWLKDGVALSGQNSATLMLTNVTAAANGNYSVTVSNGAGTITSANATLTVTGSVTPIMPSIVTQPLSLSVPAGGSATFTVTASGTATLAYQWMKNGVNLSGQTGASLTLANVTSADAGNYSVVVSNSVGAATSANATLTVQSGPGSIDLSFLSGGISNVTSLAITGDGSVIVGGTFTNILGNLRNRLCRLLRDGSLDFTFNGGAGFNGDINTLAIQGDGKIVVGGKFTSAIGQGANYLARVSADGSLDGSFTASGGANGPVDTVAIQSDGKVIIGGEFTTVNGQPAGHVARLNADGSVDSSFHAGAGANGSVLSLAVQGDGKILVGGGFTTVNNVSHTGLARLNADGSVDTSFDSNATVTGGHSVMALAVDASGRVLVGMSSLMANPLNQTNLVRLNANGSLDASFNASVNGTVRTIKALASGKVLVGGDFQIVANVSADGLAELTANGSVDTSFNAGLTAGGNVTTMALQANGNLIVGGSLELRRLLFSDSGSVGLMINSIVRANNQTSLSFQSQSGQTYVLEFKDDLSASAWLAGGTIVGNGNVQTIGDVTATGPHRFYRLRQQ